MMGVRTLDGQGYTSVHSILQHYYCDPTTVVSNTDILDTTQNTPFWVYPKTPHFGGMTTWEGYDLEIHEMALNAYENRTDHKSTIQKGSKKGGFGGVPRVSRMTTFGCCEITGEHVTCAPG